MHSVMCMRHMGTESYKKAHAEYRDENEVEKDISSDTADKAVACSCVDDEKDE